MTIIRGIFLTVILNLSVISAQTDTGQHVETAIIEAIDTAKSVSISDTIAAKQMTPIDIEKIDSVQIVSTNKDSSTEIQPSVQFFKPGEAIFIKVYPDSSSFLNGFFKIDQQCNIEYPIVGTICLKDLTKLELIEIIKRECVDFLRYPNIQIKPLVRISLSGGFYKPGLQWVDSKSSLWDVIKLAGGVQREDGLKKIRWERDGEIVSKELIKHIQSGSSLESIGFKSGDQLCVISRPKQTFGQAFRENFVPIFSLILTTATTALTGYQAYRLITEDE